MASGNRSLGRRISSAFGFALLTLVGAGLLVEVGVRLLIPQTLPRDTPELWEPDDVIGWRHVPGARARVNSGERVAWVCFDARGDRVSCAASRSECAGRVLVLGDSFVEALAIPWEQTVWSLIERDSGACVFSAGVSGYEIGQYQVQVAQRLVERFDLVILSFYVGNDFTPDADRVPPPREVQRQPLRWLPAGLTGDDLHDWFYPFNSWLESHSHAYVAGRFGIRRFRDPGDVGIYGVPKALRRSRLTPQFLDETTRGVRAIGAAAHAAGSRYLVLIIPFRSQVLDPKGERLLASFPALRGDLDMDQVTVRFLPRLEAAVEIDAVVDLLPVLRERADRETWGARDAHFSPSGHRIWFEALRGPVRELLEARAP